MCLFVAITRMFHFQNWKMDVQNQISNIATNLVSEKIKAILKENNERMHTYYYILISLCNSVLHFGKQREMFSSYISLSCFLTFALSSGTFQDDTARI